MAELPPHICFEVLGKPVTQGSLRALPVKNRDGTYRHAADGRPVIVTVHDKAPELRAWRQEVAVAARARYDGPLLVGALELNLVFEFPHLKGHYGTGRNSGKLKASAPRHKTTAPDRLKLARSVEDALTGVLWRDDAQTVDGKTTKLYGPFYRLTVEVVILDEALEELQHEGESDG